MARKRNLGGVARPWKKDNKFRRLKKFNSEDLESKRRPGRKRSTQLVTRQIKLSEMEKVFKMLKRKQG